VTVFRRSLAVLAMAAFALPALADPDVLDDFDYPSTAEAQAAWLNRGLSPKVTMADTGPWGTERVMTLPCDFTVVPDRCYWDRLDSWDLSGHPMFELELYVPDPGAVGLFTLYFRSGNGWYAFSHDITLAGWQTLSFVAGDFEELGTPAGWDQVDTVRLSPWKESEVATEMAVRELRAFSPRVFILRDDASPDPIRVDKATADLAFMLSDYDVSFGVLGAAHVENGHLLQSDLLILPYNDVYTPQQIAAIEFFAASGGKVMAHYRLPTWLGNLLGFELLGSATGGFSAYEFDDPTIPHLPDRVRHGIWTINLAGPREEKNARVIALWEDLSGAPTSHAAWLASDAGSYMSAYIRTDDRVHKQKMLLAMIGREVPEIWPPAAAAAIARIGRIAEYGGFDEAVDDIRNRGATSPRQAEIETALSDAGAARDRAIAEETAGLYADAVGSAIDARAHLQRAFALGQSAVTPEFRAVWEHSGMGPYQGDWPAGIAPLVEGGFSAVFPNSLKAGLAHYPSALLPHSSQYATHGDQVQQCLDAAHPEGIEVHVWKVNWNLDGAPQDFIDGMRAQERTQVSAFGDPIDWLCPSHPDNFALERDSMLEVLQNYDVDGLHFDYIRYPGPDYCYCDGCRARFEQETGNTVTNWPADVRSGGPLEDEFLPWRRQQITELVEAVYHAAKAIDPDVRMSAAVFGDYDLAFGSVGQDWVSWIDLGIIDTLFPMDTTRDHDEFRQRVSEQMAYAAGRIPIHPGIGVRNDRTQLSSDEVLTQIGITREQGTGGYILFQLDIDLERDILPTLALGATRPEGAGDIAERSLMLAKAGAGLLDLSWGATCDPLAGPADYAVYRGTLSAGPGWTWDHEPVTCSTAGNTFDTVPMGAGDHYFLVVASDTNREGGYGYSSDGPERPAATTPCVPQVRTPCP